MTDEVKQGAAQVTEKSFPLKFPITYTPADGKPVTISALKLRRTRGKEMRLIEEVSAKGGGETALMLALLASINDLPVDALDEIDAEDLIDLSEAANDFFPSKVRQAGGQ